MRHTNTSQEVVSQLLRMLGRARSRFDEAEFPKTKGIASAIYLVA
jgi:hypothetical protein